MALSPSEILHKEFDSKFRGYDPDQVNDFLDIIVAEFEKLTASNQQMSSKIADMQDKLNYFQQLQESLNSSIVVAQEAAERLKQNARKEAELILYEAEREADRLVEDATKKTQAIISESEVLKKSSIDFKKRLINMVEAQLNLINREEYQELFNAEIAQSVGSTLNRDSSEPVVQPLEQDSIVVHEEIATGFSSRKQNMEIPNNYFEADENLDFDFKEESIDSSNASEIDLSLSDIDAEEVKLRNETFLGRTISIDLPNE